MKQLKFYFFILFAGTLLLASCSKEGATGPVGTTGAIGTTGATGAVGPAGANGTVIYSGTTDPVATEGVTGDFYINLSSGMLFGPKTATGWGTGTSLIGTTGATGATGSAGATGPAGPTGAAGAAGKTGVAGSQIYSGSGTPSVSLGITGDYYLDKTNFLLYGPKTAAGWGAPIGLQGPAGPAGPQGPEGNANVMSEVFSITNTQWLWNSQYEFQTNPSGYTEYFTRYYDESISQVTQSVLNTGLVLVYFTPNLSDNTNQWAPLPYEFTDASGDFNYNVAYETNVGTVRLHYFFVQLVATATIPTLSNYDIPTYQFKIVVVTGTAISALRINHINFNDYQAVSRVTGLWQQDKPNK